MIKSEQNFCQLDKDVTPKDIHNLIAKSKYQHLGECKEVDVRLQELLSEFCEKEVGNTSKMYVVNDNITCVTFQTGFMRKIFEAFPQILFVDATYNTNVNRYKLFSFMVQDAFGKGQFVQHALLDHETSANMMHAIESFKQNNNKWEDIKTIMVLFYFIFLFCFVLFYKNFV